MIRLVLFGPPGAGKGTQAHRLADRFDALLISTGDIFRKNLRDRTELGLAAKQFMDAGDLVPDDVVVAMVLQELARPRAVNGFILDGFPRTLGQAKALEAALTERGTPLTAVMKFTIPDELAVKRLAGRRTCHDCQRTFNVEFSPPRNADTCDVCGGPLEQRDDDHELTVRHRLDIYHRDTEPVERFFAGRGLLHEVDAMGPVVHVTERAVAALNGLIEP